MATSSTVLEPAGQEATIVESCGDTLPIVRLAAHELRQSFSSMESVAFYLKMVLARSEPKLCEHAAKIEDLVQQANWVLTDAMHALSTAAVRMQPVDLTRLARRAAYEISREEHLRVHVAAPDEPITVDGDASQLDYMIRSACRCLIRLQQSECKLLLSRDVGEQRVVLDFFARPSCNSVEVAGDFPSGSLDLALGGIRATAEKHGGSFRCSEGVPGASHWEIELPLAPAIEKHFA
jgi:hypothetical protein